MAVADVGMYDYDDDDDDDDDSLSTKNADDNSQHHDVHQLYQNAVVCIVNSKVGHISKLRARPSNERCTNPH